MINEIVLSERARPGQPEVLDVLVELQHEDGSRSYLVRTIGPSPSRLHDHETDHLGDAVRTAALRGGCEDSVVEATVRASLDALCVGVAF